MRPKAPTTSSREPGQGVPVRDVEGGEDRCGLERRPGRGVGAVAGTQPEAQARRRELVGQARAQAAARPGHHGDGAADLGGHALGGTDRAAAYAAAASTSAAKGR